MKIFSQGDEKLVEVLDDKQNPILNNPISVGIQNYCWIFAWADNQNPFEFDTVII